MISGSAVRQSRGPLPRARSSRRCRLSDSCAALRWHRSRISCLAFGEASNQAGFVDGQNVKIEYRYAENQRDRLPALVTDLAHLPVAGARGE